MIRVAAAVLAMLPLDDAVAAAVDAADMAAIAAVDFGFVC